MRTLEKGLLPYIPRSLQTGGEYAGLHSSQHLESKRGRFENPHSIQTHTITL